MLRGCLGAGRLPRRWQAVAQYSQASGVAAVLGGCAAGLGGCAAELGGCWEVAPLLGGRATVLEGVLQG